ncbi:hypothetical protein ASPFODRAFT_202098 [Aspergillus luchuensis CBS 106.47]|uniref:Uncharacterized protein n=1 Tax=Aspergillus luchuensis (strain CBS 106.47) TaxID=1137211 RepID=A0A1M3TZT3_ASPLC|nr:hypothetical protein ASPFODRAFT_202098 [Aspergillus luchuensis CBS 106.47]
MAKPYASQPLYHSIVLPVSFEHPTAVLVQDMSTNPHTLGLWNIAHRTFHQTLEGHIGGLMASAISHGRQIIATGTDTGILRFVEHGYDASGKLGHHLNRVHTFAFSPNGELISDWGGGIVCLWNLRVGNGDSNYFPYFLNSFYSSPCPVNPTLITLDGATLWDFPTGTSQNQLEALKIPFTGPEFSGDGRLVAAFAEVTILVWDTGSGKFIRALELDIDESDIECYASIKAASRPDGKVITWALDTLQFQVWDPISGKKIEPFNGSIELTTFEVSHNGHLLAVTDHTKVGIRELSSGKHLKNHIF